MPDTQFSGQVVLPNDGQVSSLTNPEPNQIADQITAQRTPSPLAAPVVAPSAATPSATNPTAPQDAPGGRDHLMGRMVGKLMSGLQGEHTEYSIDPNTGQTVPTQVKEKPGSVFKSILAYGLLGGQGIGPKEGEQTFSQGLLAGLGSGVRTSMEQREKLDAQRRAAAQQQYQNELKAREESRQSQELVMKQKLNDAAIASYTAETTMSKYKLASLMQENQKSAVQQMQAKDAPMLQTFQAAGMRPIKEGLNPAEFQKLLADNTNDINAHKVIPVVTGYTSVNNPDGSIHWEPVGALYPPATKYTADTLSQLKDAGYKESDPLYKDIALKVKNGASVDPREFLTTYREIGQHFDYAKARSEIAKNEAEIVRARAEASEASTRGKLAGLQLQNAESAQLGKYLLNYVGTDTQYTRPGTKQKISIPVKSDGSFDFSQLNDKEKSGLRDYIGVLQEHSQNNLDKFLTALRTDPDNPQLKNSIQDENKTLSSINNMFNSLNGTRDVPRVNSQPTAQPTEVDQIRAKHMASLAPRLQGAYAAAIAGGGKLPPAGSFSEAVSRIKAAQNNPDTKLSPEEATQLIDAMKNYYAEATPVIKKAAADAEAAANRTSATLQDALDQSNQAEYEDFRKTHFIPVGGGMPTYK